MQPSFATQFVAECFWPGVREADLSALDQRAAASAAELTRSGETVRYLGSLLMPRDEVVLCRFEGSETSVRRVAEEAAIPFERILEVASSPWPGDASA
ncbi:MAG: nickel-binding protein [Candidatus Dormibacteria bacterium]